jgi:hypothetical protein
LLFCADHLHGFYGRLDWRLFADPPLVQQHGMAIAFTLNPATVRDGIGSAPAAGRLDLRGPPW